MKNIVILSALIVVLTGGMNAGAAAAAMAEKPWPQRPEQGVATRVPADQWRTLYERWGLKGGGGRELDWQWGFRAGNGTMGALVMGDVFNDTIYLTHERMYVPVNESYFLPDMGPYVSETRRLIREKGYVEANKFYYEKARELGYKGIMQTDPIHPAFVLNIRMPRAWDTRPMDYLMTEDFQTGEVAVQWTDQRKSCLSRRLFVSRPDNVMVLAVASETGKKMSCAFELESIPVCERNAEFVDSKLEADKDWIVQRVRYQRAPGGYDSVLRVVARGGEVRCDGKQISVCNADSILVLGAVEPVKDPAVSKVDDLKKKLLALPGDYASLLAPHVRAHGELYNRVKLDLCDAKARGKLVEDLFQESISGKKLTPALLEKVYNGSRYLYLCASGDVPPWLLGRWVGSWQPAWSGDLTLDTNTELAMMGALSANQPELLARSLGYFESLLPDWRENAKKLHGCRGIMSCIRAGRIGLHHHWATGWSLQQWTAGAGWLGSWFYDYYRFTGDRDFLAKRCVPYLKEVALFYEDFLFLDESGKYRFSPSYSPETASLDNATMDIAVAREVLMNLVAACEELGVEKDGVARWRAMLGKLPDYMINGPGNAAPALDPKKLNLTVRADKDTFVPVPGTVKEFAVPGMPEFYDHRHFSHLYPVMYSYEVTPEKDPKLWEAFNLTLTEKLRTIRGHDAHGRMHGALAAAYLRRGEDVWTILTKLVNGGTNHGGEVYTSMHTAHFDGNACSCFDANGALPAVVNNSLIFRRGIAANDPVDLLPALPAALARGRIEGVLLRGQIRVDVLEWDTVARKISLALTSGKAQEIILRLPSAAAIKDMSCVAGNQAIADGPGPQSRAVRLPAGTVSFQIAY